MMPNSEMQIATDLAITDILHANAAQVLENNELEPSTQVSALHAKVLQPCCVHKCRVTTSGYITSQSAYGQASSLEMAAMTNTNKARAHVESHQLSDHGAANQIEQSIDDFENGKGIISHSLKTDLIAIEEVEAYLNQKEIFLDTNKDCVYWQQDEAHDQTRFHFVMSGKGDDRSRWLASDARYVRTRLEELVGNLAYELKILKEPLETSFKKTANE